MTTKPQMSSDEALVYLKSWRPIVEEDEPKEYLIESFGGDAETTAALSAATAHVLDSAKTDQGTIKKSTVIEQLCKLDLPDLNLVILAAGTGRIFETVTK